MWLLEEMVDRHEAANSGSERHVGSSSLNGVRGERYSRILQRIDIEAFKYAVERKLRRQHDRDCNGAEDQSARCRAAASQAPIAHTE